jgi:hypothetical protein
MPKISIITPRLTGWPWRADIGFMKRWSPIAILALGILSFPSHAHDVVTTKLTWNREISRIAYSRCVSCHQPGGRAFSLMTYAEARPWAVAIKEEVLARRMPPWGAVKGFGDFRNDGGLTAEQIEWITAWVGGGVPEGDPADLETQPKIPEPAAQLKPKDELVVSGDTRLSRAFIVDGLLPLEVPVKQSIQIIATFPNGRVEPLLWLYEYQSTFPHPFLLRTPLELPRGTVIAGVPKTAKIALLPPTDSVSTKTN